jgi:hypothetical protein
MVRGFVWMLSILAIASLPATAFAEELVWMLSKQKGRPYLTAMPDVSEVDFEFWARCRADGTIDIGMGAESHVGKGKGERVSLTLASAGQTVTISGVSRESANVEMTGGIELRARVTRDDKLFALLMTGQPISVTGPIKPLKWEVKGLKAKVEAFLKGCRKG